MKNISLNSSKNKNSSSGSSYDLLLYLLIFLLIVTGASLIVYWYNRPKPSQTFNFDEPTLEEIKEIADKINSDTENTFRERNDQKIKELTNKIENDLPNISNDVKSKLKDKLKIAEQTDIIALQTAILSKIYSCITPLEKSRKQLEIEQPEWLEKKFPEEREEIFLKTDKLINHFYERFMKHLKSKGYKEVDLFYPVSIDGRDVEKNFTPEDVEKCRPYTKDIFFHPKIKFEGFKGFLGEGVITNKEESENIIGLTTTTYPTDRYENWNNVKIYRNPTTGEEEYRKGIWFRYIYQRIIFIELKKEACFSWKKSYDKWIKEIKPNDKMKGYFTISSYHVDWLEVEDTITHELAHAVISSTHETYEPKNGGHGPLHTQFTREIKEMMRNDPIGIEYKKWWTGEDDYGQN